MVRSRRAHRVIECRVLRAMAVTRAGRWAEGERSCCNRGVQDTPPRAPRNRVCGVNGGGDRRLRDASANRSIVSFMPSVAQCGLAIHS